jgi:hypothetical protein
MGKEGSFSRCRQALNWFEPIHLGRDVADTVRPRAPSGGRTPMGVPLPWLGDGQKATLPPTPPLSPSHSLFSSLALAAEKNHMVTPAPSSAFLAHRSHRAIPTST